MILIPYSFNGTSLNSTDYETSIPRQSALLQMQTQPIYVERAGAVSIYAGKKFQPVTMNLEILMKNSPSDFMGQFENLNYLFDTKDETPRIFICSDTQDTATDATGKQYYVYATAKQVTGGNEGPMAVVTLAFDDPIWQSVKQYSQTFATTSSTDSTSVTAAGNDYSYPILEITPTTQPSTDYLYSAYVQVIPQAAEPFPARGLYLQPTTSTFDTAALVAAGYMQADGDDLRVFRDGLEIDRQLSGINTTDTKVLVVADMPPARTMTLKTALASTDTITEIEVFNTTANKTVITAMPNAGRLIVDSGLGTTDTEEFTYTAKTITSTKLAFTIGASAVRGTARVNHSSSDFVRFLPYDFTIVYGNSTVEAPTIDSTRIPIFNTTDSSNSSFVYGNFFDLAGTRANTFKPKVEKVSTPSLTRSTFFTSTNDEGDTDPATALGIAAYTYLKLGVWSPDAMRITWKQYFPDGISSLTASGEQFQTIASRPSFYIGLAVSASSSINNAATIAAQVSTDYGTWGAWTKASTDFSIIANAKLLAFVADGTISSTTDVTAKTDITALTVGLTNPPHVMVRDQTNNYKLDATITNETTGEFFTVVYPMLLNETLYIDTDPSFPTVKYNGQVVNGAISLSSVRPDWLRLNPGANTISYMTNLSGASDISIVVKWKDRANFL